MTVYLGEIETFPNVQADKAQALKVLEESAEVYSAWENYDRDGEWLGDEHEALLCECADVIQAVANLVAALGVHNFTLYLEECERRNRERGRYEQA